MSVEWPPQPLVQPRAAPQLVRAAHSQGSSACRARSTSACREGYLEKSDVATHKSTTPADAASKVMLEVSCEKSAPPECIWYNDEPVQDATTDAMSSGVTSSRSMRDPSFVSEVPSSMSSAASSSSSSFCSIGQEGGRGGDASVQRVVDKSFKLRS